MNMMVIQKASGFRVGHQKNKIKKKTNKNNSSNNN